MAAFSADLNELKTLYDAYGEDLFALCYLETARGGRALDLMAAVLCDMAASPKLWAAAQASREGFFRVAYLNCMDDSLRRPKRRKKKKDSPVREVPRASLPFSLTDPLRAVLRLRLPAKGALFFQERLGFTPEQAGHALGCSPARSGRLWDSALKKGKVTAAQAKAALNSLAPGEDTLDRVWQEFLQQRQQGGFAGRQRYRRFRRAMDNAVPYLAAAVVLLCGAAFFGVEYGWFGGVPYAQTQPIDGVTASDIYRGDSQTDTAQWVGDVSVFVPEEGGFAEYVVHNTPGDPAEILRQMVYLGGAPEGTSLLSVNLDDQGTEASLGSTVTYTHGDSLSLTVELSDQAAALSGETGEAMLQAMTATFAGFYEGLDQISFRCGGEELTVNGKTAQEFLDGSLPITRTVDTDYRE